MPSENQKERLSTKETDELVSYVGSDISYLRAIVDQMDGSESLTKRQERASSRLNNIEMIVNELALRSEDTQ